MIFPFCWIVFSIPFANCNFCYFNIVRKLIIVIDLIIYKDDHINCLSCNPADSPPLYPEVLVINACTIYGLISIKLS